MVGSEGAFGANGVAVRGRRAITTVEVAKEETRETSSIGGGKGEKAQPTASVCEHPGREAQLIERKRESDGKGKGKRDVREMQMQSYSPAPLTGYYSPG